MDALNRRHIVIHEPVWNRQAVGIAEHKLDSDLVVEIDYKTKSGKRAFPHVYFIKLEKALTFQEKMVVGGGTTVRLIPIRAFDILEKHIER